jgi:hypothetical protein
MWKLSQGLLYAILIVIMPNGAYARGGLLHLFVPTTKPNIEMNIHRRRPPLQRVPCTTLGTPRGCALSPLRRYSY